MSCLIPHIWEVLQKAYLFCLVFPTLVENVGPIRDYGCWLLTVGWSIFSCMMIVDIIWWMAAMQNAVEQPSKYLGRWAGTYTINVFVVVWVLIVGFGFGGWASMTNFIRQIDTFGLFTKCYQCPPPAQPASPPPHGFNATAAAPLHHPFNHTHRPWFMPLPEFAQLQGVPPHGTMNTYVNRTCHW